MKILIKISLLLFVFVIFIGYIAYKEKQPFMFLDIEKVSKTEIYKSPMYLESVYGINFLQNLDLNNSKIISNYFEKYLTKQDRDFYTDMLSVTNATKNLIIHGSKNSRDKHRNIENILDVSGEYRNVCSEAAKVSTIFWQLLGYKSRVVWGGNHVMTEVYNKELKKWVLVDSDSGVYAKHNDKLLNFLETRESARKEKNAFLNIYTNKLTDKQKYNIDLYSRTQFFILIDADDLFEFHSKFRDPMYILKYILLDTKNEIKGLQSSDPKYKKLGNKEII